MRKTASTTVSVHPLLAERWSPRGFDRAHEIGGEALAALLEAARWAPSAGNSQPWRFLVTRRGEPAHDRLFAALAPGNQAQADGLAVHQMGGFDTDAVRAGFGLGEDLTPVVVLAVGRHDSEAGLPEPLAAREAAPRTRRPLGDLLLPAPAADPVAA
jgi:nitroreductase